MRVGIDVGGTNTDAVLMNGSDVLAAIKQPTSRDVSSGIVAALRGVLALAGRPQTDVTAVMLGTTHFTNAVVARAGLASVAAIRIATPSSRAVPPFADWPEDLAGIVNGATFEISGGYEFDGRPIATVDPAQVDAIVPVLLARGIEAVAITGVFSPLCVDQELMVRDRLLARQPGLHVAMSHEQGRVGLLERENATILNASLLPLAAKVMDAFAAALHQAGVAAPLFVSQNDGTLMNLAQAARFPVRTFSSGPTNSLRGAAFLSGVADAIVVDIGGTTADVGILVGGFPRPANAHVDIGGVRCNVRMPDLVPLGIGGGSLVDPATRQVGPRSVGHRLSEEALVFGGTTLTATDLAVAAGLAVIGEPALVADLPHDMVEEALSEIRARIAVTADLLRTSAQALPVILVGGGGMLLAGDLPGFGGVIRPAHAGCANAVGAAIAQVGAEVEKIVAFAGKDRAALVQELIAQAQQAAVAAGAAADTVGVTEIDEVPIAYLPGDCMRVRIKAVGNLALVAPAEGARP